MIHHGDCIDVMAEMAPDSVDAVVTDPPYGLEFMGKEWDRLDRKGAASFEQTEKVLKPFLYQEGYGPIGPDGRRGGTPQPQANPYAKRPRWSVVTRDGWQRMQEWHQRWAEAAYRVAKPSAYLLAFGGTRTVHRMTVALEDAGWIIRDMLVWGYASGFPKSKASLKPAWEPIVMARKPGPLRMLAIDECRIEAVTVEGAGLDVNTHLRPSVRRTSDAASTSYSVHKGEDEYNVPALGRWPANIVLTDPIFDGGIAGVVGGGEAAGMGEARVLRRGVESGSGMGLFNPNAPTGDGMAGYGDSGTYSRFFLVPKAARSDREPVLGGLPKSRAATMQARLTDDWQGRSPTPERANVHPTVKPTDLMRHLVRLVTPTGGIVLDPFLGSGTTALAAEMEGFEWIGIEREADYVAIAEARLNGTQRGLGLAV